MMVVNGEKCWRSEGLECGERLEIAGNCCGTEKNVRVLIILKKLKKWALWGGRLLHDWGKCLNLPRNFLKINSNGKTYTYERY